MNRVFSWAWTGVSVFSKAMVSGLPGDKMPLKPYAKSRVHQPVELLKKRSGIYYRRTDSKPVVEKQTLLKEKKKARLISI